MDFEGPYDNDPQDPGGETCYGITRRYEPEWPGWARVNELKAGQDFLKVVVHDVTLLGFVKAYYQAMWDGMQLSDIEFQPLADCIFNGCINQGKERTIKWLQYCTNALSPTTLDLPENGVISEPTIAQLKTLITEGYGDMLWMLLKAQRMAAYTVTCHNRDESRKYIKGWIGRLESGG